ncbi:FAD-binding oxidoreductase [Caulobacter sp. KR2-114]|uniref:FAD-binding oxidoreductase n=1 Tax=Caulobacter sp. KR2-114 TaxID=3400912 RepID=UPI003BFF667C
MVSDMLLARLERAVGKDAVVAGEEAARAGAGSWGRMGAPAAVLKPTSVQAVSEALKICHQYSIPVTPWGGRTGLVAGAWADHDVALSLERMNKVEVVDADSNSMVVQAGCPLQAACAAAEAEDLFFPLDLGSRGSATIGGNIATNAGGNRVIRFGMMRENVLGLEVVLANGTIVSAMHHLIKNNAGYDLKQLFIGSEGTLGVITRAVLRMRPLPQSQDVAVAAVNDFSSLPKLLRRLDRQLGGRLSAFEVMWADFYRLVTTAPAPGRPPLPPGHAYYVLIEALGADPGPDAQAFEAALAAALEAGEIADAVIAKDQAERDALWALRDDVGQVARDGPVLTFDVSLGVSQMQSYVAEVRAALHRWRPDATLTVFGHLGDGNLHLIVGASPLHRYDVESIVYRPLRDRLGSISAEHGVGLDKRAWLWVTRSAEEVDVMRAMKRALDPLNILNPGKIFEVPVGQPSVFS